jgi:hypothetical protein
MPNYQPVEVKNNWGRLEYYLGGEQWEPLTGTKIMVRWNQGEETEEVLLSESYSEPVFDHGHVDYVLLRLYFIEVMFRGVKIRVPIESVSVSLS